MAAPDYGHVDHAHLLRQSSYLVGACLRPATPDLAVYHPLVCVDVAAKVFASREL